MVFDGLPARLARIRAEIARGQAAGGWRHPVTIVAVTKGFGPEAVRAARDAGLSDVGENRVQEALEKMSAVPDPDVVWHLIGHLQRNKARQVPGRFALVHSLDSPELAQELNRRAAAAGVRQRVLVQVNVAGEAQKSGCALDAAPALVRQAAALEALAVEGLMTIAPLTDDVVVQRGVFRELRRLRDSLQEEGQWVPTLSMGMSADYATAVEEGATVIRLGTALFGERTA
jgi:pyridoxal phosphate enzyme (YggS family)